MAETSWKTVPCLPFASVLYSLYVNFDFIWGTEQYLDLCTKPKRTIPWLCSSTELSFSPGNKSWDLRKPPPTRQMPQQRRLNLLIAEKCCHCRNTLGLAISDSLSSCSGDDLTVSLELPPSSSSLRLLVLTVHYACVNDPVLLSLHLITGRVWLESISCSHLSVSWWESDCFRKWFWVKLHFFIFHLFLACGTKNIREKLCQI